MKDKYIEEIFPRYFIFGEYSDGRVDLASPKDTTLATVSRGDAARLIKDRDQVITKLCDMARAFDKVAPKAFDEFWYGKEDNV